MKIYSFQLGQLQTNCYLVQKDKKCLIIDPADEADFLLETIQRQNLELVGLLATHGHFDHVMAVGEMQLSFPSIPLHIHRKDQFLLDRLVSTAKHFLGYEPVVVPIQKVEYIETEKLEMNGFEFEVVHTPGHTPGSCSFYFPDQEVLFSGDTIFKGAIGRYDFSYSEPKALMKSMKKLRELPKETVVYSGHGEVTSIGQESEFIFD